MAMLLIPILQTALSAPSGWTNITPGIDYAEYTNSLPAKIYAMKINMCTPGLRVRATKEADRGQRTSSWAESVGATAAINGGFFKWGSYEPDGVAAGYGQAWTSSDDYFARAQIIFAEHLLEFIPAGESYVAQLPDWAEEAVNGDALLVNGGVVNDHGGTRRARTALGFNADRTELILMVVERNSSSTGMTYLEEAEEMASFGVDKAVNLDGSGSATMWLSGQGMMNIPGDGSERVVGNHLGFFTSDGGLQHNCPYGDKATFDSSGFTEGNLQIQGPPGAIVSGSLSFLNDGTEAWTAQNVRLAPLPRDSTSPLWTSDWFSENRIAELSETVQPGEKGVFHFSIQIPSNPGDVVHQELSLLKEGIHWFGDSWGPEDGTLRLSVEAQGSPDHRAELIATGGWNAGNRKIALSPGEKHQIWFEFQNTGSLDWAPEEIRLGTTNPRDHESPLAASEWIQPNRPAQLESNVEPGASAVFSVTVQAPTEPGTWTASFGLLREEVTWFADDGGPSDEIIHFTLEAEGEGSDETNGDSIAPKEEGCFGSSAIFLLPLFFWRREKRV